MAVALRRRVVDWIARGLAGLCVLGAVVPLVLIIVDAFQKGAPAFRGSGIGGFLTEGEPLPCTVIAGGVPCSDFGGIAPVIAGTFYLVVFAAIIALPVGILAGIYLSEYGRGPIGRAMSFFIDVLAGVPSIVVGLFVFTLFLIYDRGIVYSVISGGAALSIIMLPIVIRTTEESLRLVPQATREAALALGIPRYRSTLEIVLPSGAAGVVTGALLAAARAGGESAPLLFLELQTHLGFTGWNQSIVPIPLLIYLWGPTHVANNWTADAWGAALVLILMMLALSLAARFVLGRRLPGGGF